MTDTKPSVLGRFLAGFWRWRPVPADPSRPIIHEMNNVLGVVIGCFDEQIERLNEASDLDRAKLKQLAEDGLAAALRGAALTRHRPERSDD